MKDNNEVTQDKLKLIISDFIDTVFNDVMIGFLFKKADKQNLKDREFELLSKILGYETPYNGKNVFQVHKPLTIKEGQFSRRQQILKETLEKYSVSKDLIEKILGHNERFRPVIVKSKEFQNKLIEAKNIAQKVLDSKS